MIAGIVQRACVIAAAGVLAALGSAAQAEIPVFSPVDDHPACRGSQGYAADFDGRRTFLWRPQWLRAMVSDADQRRAIERRADAALGNAPYSVTHKPRLVPGAVPNDYASIGPYWWPDPAKKDGLPYTRRDGEVNPERDGPEFDKDRLRDLANDLEALSLGYMATSDERYAHHAALLLRTWFIAPATRMTPNMEFAQGIPGRVNGRGEGIIEASDLSTIVEAIGLLSPSAALTAEDHAGLQGWYRDYATWMATSDLGEDEMNKRNNHGVFFDFYLAHFALYAGLDGVTTSMVEGFPEFRLGVQMDKQGRFIEELRRTRSWHYSNYVIAGAARLATIGECVGLDLWNASVPQTERSLQTAYTFLRRYENNLASWPFPDRDLQADRFDRMNKSHSIVAQMFGADIAGEELLLP